MADEVITTETTPTPAAPSENRAEERIKQLSEKVELTAKERDEKDRLLTDTSRERDFYKDYAGIVSTQPAAKEHEGEIKEKVLKGYSVQDATFAVLGAAGKLGNSQVATPTQVAGGSASTAMPQGGEKPVSEMSQAERRAQLEKDLLWQ